MPHFTLSKSKILEQYNIVDNLCDITSYSSKTNPEITPIIEENTNSMFSIHLQNELKNVKDKSRVMFLAQAWNKELIQNLIGQGVRWFVVDNMVDFETIENSTSEEQKKEITLLFRLKLKEKSIRTEKYYVFGIESDILKKTIPEIKDKYTKIGIHFHRKSQNMSEWNLQFEMENTFNDEFWNDISVVNIGGGIPSVYANTNVQIFDGIFKKITDLKDWFNQKDIKMMIEPGRFIAAPSGKFHTKIIGIHENTIIVDGSVYNGDLDALVVPVKLLIEGEEERNEGIPYVVKGITPCSMDIFRYRAYLPEKKVGDEIIFINAGAYNFASDFCDMTKVETKIVD